MSLGFVFVRVAHDKAPSLEAWDFLCDKNVVVASGILYGMTWFGLRRTIDQPITTLLFGALICAPLAACGAQILCEVLPQRSLGVVPVIFAASVLHSLKKEFN